MEADPNCGHYYMGILYGILAAEIDPLQVPLHWRWLTNCWPSEPLLYGRFV